MNKSGVKEKTADLMKTTFITLILGSVLGYVATLMLMWISPPILTFIIVALLEISFYKRYQLQLYARIGVSEKLRYWVIKLIIYASTIVLGPVLVMLAIGGPTGDGPANAMYDAIMPGFLVIGLMIVYVLSEATFAFVTVRKNAQ